MREHAEKRDFDAAECDTEPDRHGPFVGNAVFLVVAQVVDGYEGGAEQADLQACHHGFHEPMSALYKHRSSNGDESEKTKHKKIPQSPVGQREWSSGIAKAEINAGQANGNDEPPPRLDQRDAECNGYGKKKQRRHKHLLASDHPGGGGAGGAESAMRIRALVCIQHIVEEIRSDLNRQGAGNRTPGQPEREFAREPPGKGASDADRSYGRR